MNGFCRACLLRKSQLVPLADSRNGSPILDMLASVCGIHFKDLPQLTNAICERCLVKLELANAVAQEIRDQEMLLRSLWLTDGWLVRLEEYQTREEPQSERLLRILNGSIDQGTEEATSMTIEDTTKEFVVKEELIIEDDFANALCENDAPLKKQEGEEEPCSSQAADTDAELDKLQEAQPDEKLPANRRFRCNECKRTFTSLCVYRNHLRKHEQIRQHNRMWKEQMRTCAHCKREFLDFKSFRCHVAWHNRTPGLLCCSTCGENQVTTESLKNHVCPLATKARKIVQPRYQYFCEECGKKFSSKKYYQIHRQKHEIIRKEMFKCDVCLKVFGGKVHLRNHMREHQVLPEYFKKCDECGKEFSNPNAYSCHTYRHNKDRSGSFHCPKCEKNFSTSVRLTNHKCDYEDYSRAEQMLTFTETVLKNEPIVEDDPLSSKQTYSEVMAKQDILNQDNSLITVKEEALLENNLELELPAAESSTTTESKVVFECQKCGQRFLTEKLCQNHQQTHENIRSGQFQCDICQQWLEGERTLRDHKRNCHKPTKDKPAKDKPLPKWMQNCVECGRNFTNANSYHCHMMRHRLIQSGKYRCTACGKCMTHQRQLKQHKCAAVREHK